MIDLEDGLTAMNELIPLHLHLQGRLSWHGIAGLPWSSKEFKALLLGQTPAVHP